MEDAVPDQMRICALACLALLLGVGLGYRLALEQVLYTVPMQGPGGPGSEVVIHRSGAVDVELHGRGLIAMALH